MDNEIKQILKENTQAIVSLDRKVCRVIGIIEGDPKANVDGYGTRLQKVEKYISFDKKARWIERIGIGAFLAYMGIK